MELVIEEILYLLVLIGMPIFIIFLDFWRKKTTGKWLFTPLGSKYSRKNKFKRPRHLMVLAVLVMAGVIQLLRDLEKIFSGSAGLEVLILPVGIIFIFGYLIVLFVRS